MPDAMRLPLDVFDRWLASAWAVMRLFEGESPDPVDARLREIRDAKANPPWFAE